LLYELILTFDFILFPRLNQFSFTDSLPSLSLLFVDDYGFVVLSSLC
jgi:hypothetical protein